MALSKKDYGFIAMAVVVVSVLVVLSLTGKEKFIPRTEAHLKAVEMEKEAADKYCASCHDPSVGGIVIGAQESPKMPEKHPLRKKNCRLCHRLERVKK